MKKENLPTHEECAEKVEQKKANALEKFIHENEPAGIEESDKFRSELTDLINMYSEKAEKWDTLDKKIAGYYVDENSNVTSASDLIDIGEDAASAFGYL